MSDPTTSAIDRVFDLVDKTVEKADHVLNRKKQTEDQQAARRRSRRADVDTAPSVKTKRPASTAVARRFRIVEAIASETGTTIYVVTNGVERTECVTRDFAEKILRALEAGGG